LSRAIAADSFDEPERTRVFVYLSMAAAIGATTSPLVGGWLDAWTETWRAGFALLALLTLGVLLQAVRNAPAMACAQSGRPPGWRGALADYGVLARRRDTLWIVMGGGFMRAGYFGFLTLTPGERRIEIGAERELVGPDEPRAAVVETGVAIGHALGDNGMQIGRPRRLGGLQHATNRDARQIFDQQEVALEVAGLERARASHALRHAPN
jgi:hypothetical protein